MTRKIDPLVVWNTPRSSRERLPGVVRQSSCINNSLPTSFPALISLPQDANHPVALIALQPMNQHSSDSCDQRTSSPIVLDDHESSSDPCHGARMIESHLPSQISQSNHSVKSPRSDEAKAMSDRLVMSNERPNDRMMMSATKQSNATPSPMKQSTDRNSIPIHHPQRGNASTGGPLMLPPLLSEPKGEDVVVGSDRPVDQPSQQLRPAATDVVTSSLSATPLTRGAAGTAKAVTTAIATVPPSLSAAPSRQQSIQGLLPQGSVYHVLVVDDSTMTRKMLMKTLRNRGLTNCIHTSYHIYLMKAITLPTFSPPTHTVPSEPHSTVNLRTYM